ncbi:MAG: hypothetical protein EOO09_20475 [Chitinophagaceae bacterium]|nr:MAG: hypothetical protein EOO09_20475 [Chitinophagaceae bacterium]
MKKILSVILVSSLLSCGPDEPFKPANGYDRDKVLLGVESYDYNGLSEYNKSFAKDQHLFYSVGDPQKTIKKEEGYYTMVVLDNIELAKMTKKDSTWKALLDTSSLYLLYGKYRNTFHLFDVNDSLIEGTEKNGVLAKMRIARNGTVDTVWFGPDRAKAFRVSLQGWADSAAHASRKVD